MSQAAAPRRVSVIIPSYNMATLLPEALDSVLAQTYRDWEAWVVDDGSGDDTAAVARRYAARHPDRIRYLEHPGHGNRGVSASRNLALDHARGELVAFLDADDIWEPNKLAEQVAVFDAHPEVVLVYSCALPIRRDGRPWSPSDGEAPVKLVRTADGELRVGYGTPQRPLPLFEELVRHCCLVNSAVMVRRSALDAAGRFEETMRYAEDWLLYTCVARQGLCYYIDRPLVRYRIHAQHFSASIRGNDLAQLEGTATFLHKLNDRLGGRDPRLRGLIRTSSREVYGRALSRAADCWHRGRRADALALTRFALGRFPGQIGTRRTLRFLRELFRRPSAPGSASASAGPAGKRSTA